MSMSDPIADMLTRVRNAQQARKKSLTCPYSKVKCSILDVMQEEGFIQGYEVSEVRPNIKEIRVDLKYFQNQSVIRELKRISKPGRRVYASSSKIPTFFNGLGVTVLSTPKGVMSDAKARQENVGGEVICMLF